MKLQSFDRSVNQEKNDAMAYKLKVKKISIANEAGDRVAVFNCYLVDAVGVAFKPVGSSQIGFNIRIPKSSAVITCTGTLNSSNITVTAMTSTLNIAIGMYVSGTGVPSGTTVASIVSPTSITLSQAATITGSPTLTFTANLTNIAKDQISKNFNRTLTVTTSPTDSSNKLLFSSNDVSQLFLGLTVTGAGVTTTPATWLTSITTPTEIQVSSNLTMQIQGTTVAPSYSYSGTTAAYVTFTYTGTLSLSSITVTAMTSTTNIVAGMSVSGTGIPAGTTVATIASSSSITLSQAATVAGSPTLTFNSNPTIITGMPSGSTANLSGGMTVSGTGIPYGSTILSIISLTSISITQNATVSGTNTFTFSTNPNSIYLTTASYFSSAFNGLSISGTYIPSSTTITYVSPTQVKLSNNSTGAGTAACTISGLPSYYFDTSYSCTGTGTWTSGTAIITMINVSNLAVGMYVSGTGIPAGSKITNINASVITISSNTTVAGTSATLTFSNMYVDYSELVNQSIVNFALL